MEYEVWASVGDGEFGFLRSFDDLQQALNYARDNLIVEYRIKEVTRGEK